MPVVWQVAYWPTLGGAEYCSVDGTEEIRTRAMAYRLLRYRREGCVGRNSRFPHRHASFVKAIHYPLALPHSV